MEYVCTVCGYVYDPTEGDPDSGISPGTAFERMWSRKGHVRTGRVEDLNRFIFDWA